MIFEGFLASEPAKEGIMTMLSLGVTYLDPPNYLTFMQIVTGTDFFSTYRLMPTISSQFVRHNAFCNTHFYLQFFKVA